MPLPHNALVLVADGRKILFFRNHGDENQIDLRTEAHDERAGSQGRRHARPTRPGRSSKAPATAVRPMRRPTSTSRRKTAGSRTRPTSSRSARSRNDFDALAIIAPPKALGVLPRNLHKEVERRVVCTINKEMSGRPIPDIEAADSIDAKPAAEDTRRRLSALVDESGRCDLGIGQPRRCSSSVRWQPRRVALDSTAGRSASPRASSSICARLRRSLRAVRAGRRRSAPDRHAAPRALPARPSAGVPSAFKCT